MGILREIFGPSKKEIWKSLSEQIGSQFIEGGFFSADKVVAHVKDWTVTLDTHTVSTGKSSTTYTRMRAPYVNKDGFSFKIYRKGIFSGIGKALGGQDVEVGFPEFDEDFIIKGNDEQKLRTLFANSKIRQLIELQPDICLEIKDDEGWFAKSFPEGVDELYFCVVGVIKDIDLLKALFDLYAEVLNQLCLMGSAYESNPHVEL
ncbi:hypothetical protein Cpap_1144 [Ruminiclostridium papyrosolvens DSM 2782]|uniref:DUF3137 domain-containing protein n=1 Tax=Ruminiclostridium papyrosolvens DSM 2782 TaxID=588581 RepID=F1TF11_9FIRM|nr:hypothetical protein [Ruminiclostridium papyrosolvens]EGD46949.1 hypothetical protein Cpap_1144 [Ruminiclostridium papyrosolvens DSM 2782]WES33803.1 DUF3137 domain-containing protein [Ruminiclostridium papyrosolvens DSM 2782]